MATLLMSARFAAGHLLRFGAAKRTWAPKAEMAP